MDYIIFEPSWLRQSCNDTVYLSHFHLQDVRTFAKLSCTVLTDRHGALKCANLELRDVAGLCEKRGRRGLERDVVELRRRNTREGGKVAFDPKRRVIHRMVEVIVVDRLEPEGYVVDSISLGSIYPCIPYKVTDIR